jgi:hypothetical protein
MKKNWIITPKTRPAMKKTSIVLGKEFLLFFFETSSLGITVK